MISLLFFDIVMWMEQVMWVLATPSHSDIQNILFMHGEDCGSRLYSTISFIYSVNSMKSVIRMYSRS